MSGNPRVLIPTGYGLNCEAETAHAFTLAGAQVQTIHFHDLLADPAPLANAGLVCFIGGFAFGDHLGAGRVLAAKLRTHLAEPMQRFVADGGLALGICNGFQTLVKAGLLPGLDGDYSTQTVTLTDNEHGAFYDGWVRLVADPDSPCIFTRGIQTLEAPVRHGEGRFAAPPESMQRLLNERLIPLRYADADGTPTQEWPANPNGSPDAIAAVCDPTGRILGMMPHPEAALEPHNHPDWTCARAAGALPTEGPGRILFRNAVDYLNKQ